MSEKVTIQNVIELYLKHSMTKDAEMLVKECLN